jgi:hypothetical protein
MGLFGDALPILEEGVGRLIVKSRIERPSVD